MSSSAAKAYVLLPGDARAVLRSLPEGFVQCVVTSPPYFGMRDYGLPPSIWGGDDGGCEHVWGELIASKSRRVVPSDEGSKQATSRDSRYAPAPSAFCRHCGAWRGVLGLEPTLEMYIEHIVEVMREVRRVLRDDGTLFLNLGDGYASNPAKGGSGTPTGRNGRGEGYARAMRRGSKRADGKVTEDLPRNRDGVPCPPGLKPKDLLMMPARVAIALQEDGWWLRSDVVYAKPNPLPQSARDRPTQSHEHLFLLTKRERYFYDWTAAAEPSVSGEGYRNRRDVWTIVPEPYRGGGGSKHFATFPTALVEPCILAGTSERGCCPECGAPWTRTLQRTKIQAASHKGSRFDKGATGAREGTRVQKGERYEMRTTGWHATCQHGEWRCVKRCKEGPRYSRKSGPSQEGPLPRMRLPLPAKGQCGQCGAKLQFEPLAPVSATVLDPFVGSGTTGVVALRLGRTFVGVDLSREYLRMARARIEGVKTSEMIWYEFVCPRHGRFTKAFTSMKDMPDEWPCPRLSTDLDDDELCREASPRVLSLPAAVIIKDGGGDHGLDRDAQQLAGEKLKARPKRRR